LEKKSKCGTIVAMSLVYNSKSAKRRPFKRYGAYVTQLRELLNEPKKRKGWEKEALAALNGQASDELRRLATLKNRRRFGAYFTGTELAVRLLSKCASFNVRRKFYDPSCGMGDLLLAAAKNFPLCSTLEKTLTQWGIRLTGADLHKEFVQGTKTRLIILARRRHRKGRPPRRSVDSYFPNIRVADGKANYQGLRRAETVLMNPPFGLVRGPEQAGSVTGRVSAAATFITAILSRVAPGTEVLAILPDVLRSGSFSEGWRQRVGDLAEVHLVEPYGIFDASADVDVFIARFVRRNDGDSLRKKRWPLRRKTKPVTVSDHFHVHVGRVVPHRDKKTGTEYPYIHARCVPAWETMRHFSETRRHGSPGYRSPFVVLRRTSRPGDTYRATASIIAGKGLVAVENHLVVCQPKDRRLATCNKLMRQLKTKATNDYLDSRIRCRHLTVGVVRTIPFKAA
jgi:limonene-1,2-epoxide hydrolase